MSHKIIRNSHMTKCHMTVGKHKGVWVHKERIELVHHHQVIIGNHMTMHVPVT